MTTTQELIPVGTIVTRKAGGQQYRVVDPPAWLSPDAVRTVNVDNGIEGSTSLAALAKFYTWDES